MLKETDSRTCTESKTKPITTAYTYPILFIISLPTPLKMITTYYFYENQGNHEFLYLCNPIQIILTGKEKELF